MRSVSLRRTALAAVAAGALLSACGARTGLGADPAPLPVASSDGGAAGHGAGGGAGKGASGGGGGAIASGGSAAVEDVCPSAISGPKSMFRSCSTRDGRSRVRAPTSPHVTWTTKLPTDSTGHLGLSALATDAEGHVFVVTTENFADAGAIRRARASDGVVEWTTTLAPDSATGTPVVLASGIVDVFAYDDMTKESVLEVDQASGAAEAATFGLDLYYAPGNPAVTADESLVLVHSTNVGTASAKTFVSRVRPDGAVAWTSADLASLVPTPKFGVSPSLIAIGGELAVTVVGELTGSAQASVAVAFDAETGAVRWTTSVAGQNLGGPAVRPDGTIAVLVGDATTADLVLFDPASGAPKKSHLSVRAFEIFAITTSGTVIAGTNAGQGIDGLVALDQNGEALWTKPMPLSSVTVASDGTVVVFGKTIVALDGATGATRWELLPPVAGSCVADAALTSAGGIVGLQCDGTLFGAGD